MIPLGGSCISQSPLCIKVDIIDRLRKNGFALEDNQVQIIAKTWQEGETYSISHAIVLVEDSENIVSYSKQLSSYPQPPGFNIVILVILRLVT